MGQDRHRGLLLCSPNVFFPCVCAKQKSRTGLFFSTVLCDNTHCLGVQFLCGQNNLKTKFQQGSGLHQAKNILYVSAISHFRIPMPQVSVHNHNMTKWMNGWTLCSHPYIYKCRYSQCCSMTCIRFYGFVHMNEMVSGIPLCHLAMAWQSAHWNPSVQTLWHLMLRLYIVVCA